MTKSQRGSATLILLSKVSQLLSFITFLNAPWLSFVYTSCFVADLMVAEVKAKAMMLLRKFTQGKAQLCAEQGLSRRLNRIFEFRGLAYKDRPKVNTPLLGRSR